MNTKTLAVIGIIVLGFVMLAGTGFMLYAIMGGSIMPQAGEKTALQQSFSVNDVKQIEIDAIEENVTIKTGDVTKIEVSYTSTNKKADENVRIELQGDKLAIDRISNNPKRWFFTWNNYKSEIEIIIPENFKAEYDVKTISGNIDINEVEITGDELTLKSVSGNINAEATGEVNLVNATTTSGKIEVLADAKEVSAKSTSGKIYFTGKIDDFAAKTTSGDISLTALNQPKSVNLRSTSGEVIVKMPKNISGFSVKRESTSGRYEDEFSDTESDDSLTSKYGDGKTEILLKTTSGDAEILEN